MMPMLPNTEVSNSAPDKTKNIMNSGGVMLSIIDMTASDELDKLQNTAPKIIQTSKELAPVALASGMASRMKPPTKHRRLPLSLKKRSK